MPPLDECTTAYYFPVKHSLDLPDIPVGAAQSSFCSCFLEISFMWLLFVWFPPVLFLL